MKPKISTIPESLRKKLSDAGKKGWLKRLEKAKLESQKQKAASSPRTDNKENR